METEDAIIVWNHIYIPLSYKYDLSIMIDDILPMCLSLLERDEGNQEICWASNSFNAVWKLSWFSGKLNVSAEWNSIVGDIDSVATNCNVLNITVDQFLGEWKGLLVKLLEAIKSSRITLKDRGNYILLEDLLQRIKIHGYLYQG